MIYVLRPARTHLILTRRRIHSHPASKGVRHLSTMQKDAELPSYGEERRALGKFETQVVKVDREAPRETLEKQLAGPGALIREGQVVGFPTETVYGLGANALDGSAARKVRISKAPQFSPTLSACPNILNYDPKHRIICHSCELSCILSSPHRGNLNFVSCADILDEKQTHGQSTDCTYQ
jgi:hypothetical protein